MQADQEDFAAIPGLGPVKARRLLEAFSQPFKRNLTGAQGPAGAATGAGNAQHQAGVRASAGGQQAGSSQPAQQQQQQQGDDDLDFDLADYEDMDEDPAAGDGEDMQQEGEDRADEEAADLDEPGSAAGADAGAGVSGVGGSMGAAAVGFGQQQGRGEFMPLPPQDDEYGYDDELLEEF
jgi:hypothetical protein